MRTPVDIGALLIELTEAKKRFDDAPGDITCKREYMRLYMRYRYNTIESEREKHYIREKKRLLKRQTDDEARKKYNLYFKAYVKNAREKKRLEETEASEAREAREVSRSFSVA